MKNIFTILIIAVVLCCFTTSTYSQEKTKKVINGKEVTFIDGLPLFDKADMKFHESLPELKLPDSYRNRDFPVRVDNSEKPYFREIFNQSDLECGQASGVAYNFTYEIDRLRDVAANTNENLYPTHWVFNWSNQGNGTANPYFDSWNIIKHAGTPNVGDYGGSLNYGGTARWMSGYDEYYRALENRIWDFSKISLRDVEGLNTLRHWIDDHLDGSDAGGLANIYISYGGVNNTLPSGTPEAGKYIITSFGSYANHALCIVGYHDSIVWDYNNDGQYTNHLDINNDGVVDFMDWEIGGVKLANSYHATTWGNDGFAFCTYNALCRTLANGGVWDQSVGIINGKDTPAPQLTYKVSLTHTSRNTIKVMAGISSQPGATEPEFVMEFPILNYQGGSKYMQGGSSNADKTLEFGLDVSSLLAYVQTGADATFFLLVDEDDSGNSGTGSIDSWSVMDYTGGTLVEIPCTQTNVPLIENDLTTLTVDATINFDVPEVLTVDLPAAVINGPYEEQLLGTNGTGPYRWKIRQDYAPTYATAPFPNITSGELSLTNNSSGYATKEIDFNFPFYGKEYKTFYPHADGYLMFAPGEYPWTFLTDEFNLFKNMMNISPYMSKVLSVGGGGIFYEGDATKATFRWKALEYSTNKVVNFAVILYPDGKIEFSYGDVDFSAWNDWYAGVSQGDGFNYNLLDISNTYTIQPNTVVEMNAESNQTEMAITESGLFYGTPTVPYEAVDIDFFIEDVNGLWSIKTMPFFTDGVNNLVIRDVTVAAGDDNVIEYGESVVVSVEIQNISEEVVNASEMTISTEDSYVTLTDATEAMESFDPGEIIIFEDAFAFDVSLEVPNNHNIIFSTAIEAEAETYESHIYLKAYAPDLHFSGITFDDGNNGYLEPGETVQVYVDLKNMGGGTAYNIDFLFENSDPYITINQSSFTSDELVGGVTATAQFEISIDGSTPSGHTTTFGVSAEADFGFTAYDSFMATIGIIFEDFESGSFGPYDWEFSGNADWTIDESNPYEGVYCMKSGVIDDNENSNVSITIDVVADGQISFYYKVSSEPNYDFLKFYIDGNQLGTWDGEAGWAEASYDVSEGEHTFMWSYEKDQSESNGEDCGRIDFIIFPPMTAQTMTCTAGPDMDICENHTPTMNASATNYDLLVWTTSGDGTFNNITLVNPTYTPGASDISSGFAELTLGVSTGTNVISDNLMVYISHLPIVYAGEDASFCADVQDILVSGMVVNTEEYEWSTSGDGYFEDVYLMETVYYPGTGDLANGAVNLSLTGIAVAPCEDNVSHDIEITLLPLPDVIFTAIDNFCQNSPAYELTEGSPAGGEYLGPNVIDGWFYPEVAGVGTHTLTYSYEDGNTCENSADLEVVVDDCTGIGEAKGNASISVTPNPGHGIFELFINGFAAENAIVEIYNVTGKLVFNKELTANQTKKLTIDISNQPEGIYYLYLKNKAFSFDEKIVIVR